MIAQLGERQTEDLKVPGSIPGYGIYLWLGPRMFTKEHQRCEQRGYGATVARLTPDQTVGRSNRSGLSFRYFLIVGGSKIGSVQACLVIAGRE